MGGLQGLPRKGSAALLSRSHVEHRGLCLGAFVGPALCPGPTPAALSQRVCFLSFLLPLQTHLPHFLTLSEPLLPPSSCYYNPQSPLQIALGSSPQRSSLTGPFVLSWGGCGTHSLLQALAQRRGGSSSLNQFPGAAIANYQKLGGLKHQKCILSQFFRPKVEIKASAGPRYFKHSWGESFLAFPAFPWPP